MSPSFPCFSPWQPPFCYCHEFGFFDSTYKWEHMVFVKGHPYWLKRQDFLLFYGWVIFYYIYIIDTYITVYIYILFFLHSSIHGHLGSFHVLAFVTMNVRVQTPLQDCHFLSHGYMLQSGMAGLCERSIFECLRNLHMFFTVAVPNDIPPTAHTGYLFFTSLPTLIVSCLFDDGHFDRCEVISHCGFHLSAFLMMSGIEHLLLYPLATCLLCKNVYSVLCPFFSSDLKKCSICFLVYSKGKV